MKTLISTLLTVLIIATPSAAVAQSLPLSEQIDFLNLGLIDKPVAPAPYSKPKPAEPPKPEPVVYFVVEGDTLTKIGTTYNVEWQRLWAKNTELTSPDLIHVGDKITVPEPSETLARDIPAATTLAPETPGVAPLRSYDGSNTYDYGYCTWYVKNRRGASIPNSLGNANQWYSRAAGMGMAVGSVPRAGAVGTTTRGYAGHVVYVESVNGDGSINISEMNAPTWGGVTYRTASASEFLYIY